MWPQRVPDKNYRKQQQLNFKEPTHTEGEAEEGGTWERNEKEKGIEKERDKERENILLLCQYNIYANHAFSICVNFITHKGLKHNCKEKQQRVLNQRLTRSFTASQTNGNNNTLRSTESSALSSCCCCYNSFSCSQLVLRRYQHIIDQLLTTTHWHSQQAQTRWVRHS